tara:strand:- start:1739 stop:2350 length:612 start_codon:yes stop_codon:yes gene_type:complete
MIIYDKKIIFIHIPKTGGTSIEDIISNGQKKKKKPDYFYGVVKGKALQHLTALEIKDRFDKFDEYLKFVTVRNPYERLISEYYWCQIKGIGHKHGQSFDDFLDYVKNIVKVGKFNENKYIDHFIPQYKFVYDNNFNIIVDKIFYFEEFGKIINFSKEITNNKNIKNIHKLKQNKKKKIKLNESQKSIIYNIYEKDFVLFNYKK